MIDDYILQGLQTRVNEQPEDNNVRLIYADRLEELGETELAQFIRIQCANPELFVEIDKKENYGGTWSWTVVDYTMSTQVAWKSSAMRIGRSILPSRDVNHWKGLACTINRGFVSKMKCKLTDFLDRKCDKCYVTRLEGAERFIRNGCVRCKYTTIVSGFARNLFYKQPITDVKLTDVNPLSNDDYYYFWIAQQASPPYGIIPGYLAESNNRLLHQKFANKKSIIKALSNTLVNWGRVLNDLAPIPIDWSS